jgi:hypothetical protein
MTLNIETKTTHYVDAFHLEAYIKELFGIEYPVPAAEETGNDVSLAYEIDGELDSFDVEDIVKLLRGEWISYRTRTLMNYMAKQSKIPTGHYVIRISW